MLLNLIKKHLSSNSNCIKEVYFCSLKKVGCVYIVVSCLFTFAGIVPWRSDITKHEVTATLQWLTNEMEIIYRNNQDLYRTNVIYLFQISMFCSYIFSRNYFNFSHFVLFFHRLLFSKILKQLESK